jgi:hypothetical protein
MWSGDGGGHELLTANGHYRMRRMKTVHKVTSEEMVQFILNSVKT